MFRTILLITVALTAACHGAPPVRSPSPRGTIALEPCHLERTKAIAQCGTFNVYEDRATQQGRQIALNIAVVPARIEEPRPDPLFVLVGGPGQSATKSGAAMATVLRKVHKVRDIVLVDQRGTGESNPLRCAAHERSLPERLDEKVDAAQLRECASSLDADPRLYTTPIAMDDLDDVRAALGYDKIDLWGGSYGTRAALEYMRRHPDHVRRAVLDGVAPTDIKLTVYAGRDAQRALDLMFRRCGEDAGCNARFGDVRTRFLELLDRLSTTPEDVEVRHPRTDELQHLEMTRDRFAAMVRTILYAPPVVALLPLAIERASEGDWTPLVAAFTTIEGGVSEDMADGMFMSVVCAEDVPQITLADREKLSANFLGDTPVRLLIETCQAWPAAKMPASYYEPIVADAPTMVLSGEIDPVTPPSWGELVASRLPNATHHVIRGAAHGVSVLPCVSDAIAEFLDSPTPGAVAPDCPVGEFAPFVLDPSGARP